MNRRLVTWKIKTKRWKTRDKKPAELGSTERQVQVALGMIVARLIHPTSELGTHQWLQAQSGVDEPLHSDFSKLDLRTVYQAGGNPLWNKDALEVFLDASKQTNTSRPAGRKRK